MSILAGYFLPHPPIIVGAIGKEEVDKISLTAKEYRSVAKEIASIHPQVIILSTPHQQSYYDYIHLSPGNSAEGSFSNFGHPEIQFQVSYDEELVMKITEIAKQENFPAGCEGERIPKLDHGFLVPLSFIQKELPDTKYVRISLSGLSGKDHFRFGQLICKAVDELHRSAVFVASGDLSHTLKKDGPYGYRAEGEAFDEKILRFLREENVSGLLSISDKEMESASQCGLNSLRMMLGAMEDQPCEISLKSYEKTFGVGYAIASVLPKKEKHEPDPLVKLAQNAIHFFVSEKQKLSIPSDFPKEYTSVRKATFVSIHEHGELRGCIGTLSPFTFSLAQEVIDNAISACSRDPRFPPVRKDELNHLEISVDVLEEPLKVNSLSELNPKIYGVIVSSGFRKGVLLPDLEGIDTVDAQLSIALRKASISPKESYSIHRFTVTRHH